MSADDNLQTLSTTALVAEYNRAASLLGERTVNRFSDKETALRRTREIVARAALVVRSEEPPAPPPEQPPSAESKPEGKRQRKRRGPWFVFKPGHEQRPPKEGSRRATAFAMLRSEHGATQQEIEAACGWTPRQAYEAIRLIHYMHGYGLSMDKETKRVRAYGKDEAAA